MCYLCNIKCDIMILTILFIIYAIWIARDYF